MKKSIIITLTILILTIFVFTQSNAQNSPSMRSIAAAQLYQYGQAVYSRGDYSEAASVFKKILSIDPTHEGAIKYARSLNKKGEHIAIPKPAVVAPVAVKVKKVTPKMAKKAMPVKPTVSQELPMMPTEDHADLKEDIAQANQAITQLKNQVAELRQKIAQEPKGLPLDSKK